MQLLEVPTYNCHGWGGRERHAWNIIKLDDGFHNVDCTWDDSLSNYDYFNLSDAENDSHRRMEFSVYLPPCVSSNYRPAAEEPETGYIIIDDSNGTIIIQQGEGHPGTDYNVDDNTEYIPSTSSDSSEKTWTEMYEEMTGINLKEGWDD